MKNSAFQPTSIKTESTLTALVAGALLLALTGCSGDGTARGFGPDGGLQEDDNPVVSIAPNTGAVVEFENADQRNAIGADYIEYQWVAMQTCLNINAQTPTFYVVSGELSPLSGDDDVLRYIDGSILATSTVTESDVTIQVTEADFDGSLGNKGNSLRSIVGRYLWSAENLPARDYPYQCANQ